MPTAVRDSDSAIEASSHDWPQLPSIKTGVFDGVFDHLIGVVDELIDLIDLDSTNLVVPSLVSQRCEMQPHEPSMTQGLSSSFTISVFVSKSLVIKLCILSKA